MQNNIMSVGLTKSISGFVLKAWKSSSFIDTNMLASMPRDVPMPYKTEKSRAKVYNGVCKLRCVCLQAHSVATVMSTLSELPFYQVGEVRSSQPEKPRLALQPVARGLKQSTGQP